MAVTERYYQALIASSLIQKKTMIVNDKKTSNIVSVQREKEELENIIIDIWTFSMHPFVLNIWIRDKHCSFHDRNFEAKGSFDLILGFRKSIFNTIITVIVLHPF